MNIQGVLRLMMALVKVLKVNPVELAAAYNDAATCQATLDEIVMLVNKDGKPIILQ